MKKPRYKVAVVTGSRAEFGLLEPVMRAIRKHPRLTLQVVAAGAHFLPSARTIREVEAKFRIAARVPMQRPGKTGRAQDAAAVGRGIDGFTRAFARLKPDWVVVLGDRIEAFAAASAASIAGLAVCHIHGGDRAEGLADEAMRHAITKLAHLHCAATKLSGRRILSMGERPEYVHVTGSPAVDGLNGIKALTDAQAGKLGDPRAVVLLHPAGIEPRRGWRPGAKAESLFAAFTYFTTCCLPDEPPLGPCRNVGLTACGGNGPRRLFLEPNHDPGREQILSQWLRISRFSGLPLLSHLPRETFIALLKRMARRRRGLLIGNSSAGLIECAALGVPALDLGPRQAGRERANNVVHADPFDTHRAWLAVRRADRLAGRVKPSALFGDGRASPRIAALLARTAPHNPALLRKRNTY